MRPAVPQRADHSDINFDWLVQLRWLVWGGHLLLVAWAVGGLSIRLPTGLALGTVFLALTSNAAAHAYRARGGSAGQGAILGLMLVDVALETAFFFLTGGPFNPFTALYLVNLVLGTLVLSRARQWVQLAASFLGFASLFGLEKLAPEGLQLPNHQEMMRLHLTGMLVAFAVAAAFIVYFMQRVQASSRARDAELEAARKLAALTTLAAGAAHELATPLGTIALTSKELEHALEKAAAPPACVEDARLVRAQVERCRAILQSMAAGSGELTGEQLTRFAARDWLAGALEDLQERERVRLPDAPTLEGLLLEGPRAALTQALKNLLKNALAAAPAPHAVHLSVHREAARVVVEVQDEGAGMSAQVLSRVGEPFFTTREPGQGMGLGVFLARTLAEQLGGRLGFRSAPGAGTTARLELPVHLEAAR